MLWGGLAATAAAWLLSLALPGVLWSLALFPGRPLLWAATVGLAIGTLVLPVAALALAWLGGTVVSAPLLLLLGLAASLAAVAVRRPSLPPRGDSGDGGGAALALAVGLVAALFYEGTAVGYWDTYVAAPAMAIVGEPLEFVDAEGWTVAEGPPASVLLEDLAGGPYGIVTRDQHLGAGALAAPHVLLLGELGFRASFALQRALAAAGVFLAARALLGSPWPGIAAATLLGFNSYALSVDALNPNAALMAGAAVLAAIAAEPLRGRQLLAVGLLLGSLGGVRSESVLFVPAAMWAARPLTRRRLALILGGALLAASPFLAWNRLAFGSMLAHPSQYGAFEGWRPTFQHRVPLLGTRFSFNGLLNWPFHDEVVRTPHFPLPTFLVLPLTLVRSLGVALSALAAIGALHLWRTSRREASFLLLWCLPLALVLLPQENWDEMKMTFLLPLLPAAALAAAAGVRGARPWPLLASVLALAALVRLCGFLEYPPDPRWAERFPRAQAAPGAELPEGLRDTQYFFHVAEGQGELEAQRERLTAASLLPDVRPLPQERLRSIGEALARESAPRRPGERRRLVDVWRYIYG